jgi:hypothetical protein
MRMQSSLAWRHDSPPFNVRVHSPEKQSETVGGPQYASFQVSTTFSPSPPSSDGTDAPTTVTVERRYSHFVLLHSLLLSRYPLLTVPSLPPPSYVGRLGDQFVEARRRELERWCGRVGRHAVLRSSEEVRSFLVLENERVSPSSSSLEIATDQTSGVGAGEPAEEDGEGRSILLCFCLPSRIQHRCRGRRGERSEI